MRSQLSRRILALLLTLAMILTLVPTVFAADAGFTDVEKGKYYYDAVQWAVENKVTSGISKTEFGPDNPCTRGQVVTFLWRAFGEPKATKTEHPFTDVNEKGYYFKAMLWAVEKKITTGTSKTAFSPDKVCTRGQVVTFLWRAADEPEASSEEHPFQDVSEKGFYFKAMLWAVENKITTGTGKTTFSPDNPCTRGQVVTFLFRAKDYYEPEDPNKPDKDALEDAVDVAEDLNLGDYTPESAAAFQQALAAAQAVLNDPNATQEQIDAALAALQAAQAALQPASKDFVLSGTLKDGDEVVIYNAGNKLAIKNETDNDWYLMGAEATVDEENHKIVEPAADIVWTVGVGEDGTYTFSNGENMIVCWPSGNYLELTNNANYAGAVKEWKLKEADKATYSYYIYNATLSGQYGPGWLEFYTKNDVTKVSCYSTSEDRLNLPTFGFQFYVKGAEYVEPGPGPGPGPGPEGDFVLSNDLSDGNEVVLYNAGNGMALTAEMSGYYVKGTAVTPADHKIANPAANIVWTIGSDEAGNLILRNGEKVLALTQSPKDGGGFYNNLSVDGGDFQGWTVVDCDPSTYSFYLYANGAQEQYGHVYLEWYGSKTAFSAYDTTNISAPNFGFQFYVKGAEWIDPGPGPIGENKVFVKVTEAPEDWTGTYVIARAKDEVTAYVFDGANDKNENFIEAPLAGDQITASTDNAIVIEKSGEGYTFQGKGGYLNGKDAANGLVFATEPAVGSIAFADGLPTITSATGTVFRFNNKTYTDASYLWFRFFKPDSSVTTDANTYIELYKLDEGIEPPPPPVNKTALKAAIDTAKALNPEKYTEDSFAAVTAALETAEAVYANADATQEDVDAAAKALNDAIAALVKIPVEGDFVLAVPENGDEVVIVNAASGLAIKNEPNDKEWYLLGGEVTVDEAEHKLAEPDEALVWTVSIDGNGMTRFTSGDNVITCWPSGSYFELTNNTAHDGSVTDWALVEADAATYSFYIKSWSLSGSYGPVWLEFYKASSSDPTLVCKAYSASEDKLNLENYGFQFYVKGAEYVDPGETIDKSALQAAVDAAKALDPAKYTEESFAGIAEPLAAAEAILAKEDATQEEIDAAAKALNDAIAALEKIPGEGEEYVLTNALKDGDKVIIYHPTSGMAVSNADLSASQPNYRAGVAVTPEDDKIIDPEDAIVWTVSEAGACFVFEDAEGHQLSCSANNLKLDAEYTTWRVVEGGIEGTVNIINDGAPAGTSGDPRAMEWYAQYSEFSCYYLTATNDAFALQLFVKTESEPPVEQDLLGKIVILHTNDTHGAIMGFANVAGLKAEYEARGAEVILVDAGDFSQGTPYVSSTKGMAAIEVMNAAGYDYVTLGNHEFDFGYTQLKTNLESANFEVLCADIMLKEGGGSAFRTRAIKEINGFKIGFFGMETPETFTKVNPGLITEITFPQGEAMYKCAQDEVQWLKDEGADIIIGIVHLGVDGESEPNRSIDLYNHVEGIDFLIDGHSHTVMTEGPNGEPIQSTGTKADSLSFMNIGCIIIDPTAERKDGRISNELLAVTEDTPVDEATAAVAQGIMDVIDAEYKVKFATSEVELNGDKAPGNRTEETNMGDLITDAMLWSVLKDMDAETLGVPEENVVAITNGGGIREWIHAGDVTKSDVNTVLPFGNTVAVVYVTGAELLEALEASTYCTPDKIGGFPQVSGMKYTIDTSKDFDQGELYPDSTYHAPATIQRVTINEINGQPFDPAAKYAVVTNNFCAVGGDTYYVFVNASAQFDTGIPMDEALIDFITTELEGVIGSEYAEPQGRITILEDLHGKTVILHTNDTHGALLGFAQVAAVEAQLKEQGAEVILVDAGDYSQGTPYVSSTKGAAAIAAMNAAGYDFATLGNHEFDFGYAQLKANLENAEFRVLCADVFLKENGEAAFYSYAVEDANGVKIGFFGMETPETLTKVNPALITELSFPQGEEMYEVARGVVNALRNNEGVDLVIGLVHLGVDGESEPNRSIDLFNNVEGIDFLIDGHSHTVMEAGPNGEPIQSTGTKASKTALMNVGAIVIDNETKAIEKNYLIALGDEAPVDETVAAAIREITDPIDAEYSQVFATSGVELNGDKAPGNRTEETNMGDLIADALKWSVMKDMDAETLGVPEENVLAITNGGGIREWIHVGEVTKSDVNTVLPFGNTVAVVYVTGAELLEALEASTYCTPDKVGGFPQVSGIKYNIDITKEFNEGDLYPDSTYHAPATIRRVTIDEINGQPFDPAAKYAVVTNNFCAEGGDTYYVFKNASAQFDTGIPMDEALIDFITNELNGVIDAPYDAPQGRITMEERESVNAHKFEIVQASNNSTRFGHLDMNVSVADFLEIFALGDIVTVTVGDYSFDAPVVTNYDDVLTFEHLLRCANGKQVVTLAINYSQIGVAAGLLEPVEGGYAFVEGIEWPLYATVELKEAGGYTEELAVRAMTRTNDRADYASDEEFANFRAVTTTGMGENILYRSSSPVSDEIGRNVYADALAEAAGIKTFINLADNADDVLAGTGHFTGYEGSYYATQNVKYLGLPVAFTSAEFKAGLAEGYRYIITNEAPYMIHCLEGKDRTGLSIAVLEALMGASLEEIQADYLKTYENYFDMVDGVHVALTDAQKEVVTNIITVNLGIIFDADLTTANLADEAEAYLAEIGLLEDEVITLKADLGGVVVPPEPEYVYYHGMGLADGDEVVIYHPDSGKAISNADSTVASNPERYRLGVDTTVENGIIAEPAEGTIWTVEVDVEKGIAFVDADGKYLSVPSNYGNLVLDSDCKYWTVSEAATEGCVYIISTESKGSSGDPRGIEFYQEKFTTYYASETNLTNQQTAFALELYVKTDKSTIHEHNWVAGTVDAADCTHQEITHYTCSICGLEKTEVTNDALGHEWGDEGVTTPATCTENGKVTYTCTRCTATYDKIIYAEGHVDVDPEDGICDVCGADLNAAPTKYAIAAVKDGVYYLMASAGTAARPGAKAVELVDGKVSAADAEGYSFTIDGDISGSFAIVCDNGKYLSWTSSTNLAYTDTADSVWTVAETGICYNATRYIRLFTSSAGELSFRPYTGAQSGTQATVLIPVG